MKYLYTERNLLDLPKEHYKYSQFEGKSFLDAYLESRTTFVEKTKEQNEIPYNFKNYSLKDLIDLLETYLKDENLDMRCKFVDMLYAASNAVIDNEFLKQELYPVVRRFEVTKRLDNDTSGIFKYSIVASTLAGVCDLQFNPVLFNALLKLNDICISVLSKIVFEVNTSILCMLYSLEKEIKVYNRFVKGLL